MTGGFSAESPRVALVVNNAARMGGAERQCLLLAGELARRGWTPVLLSLAGGGPVLEEAAARGMETGAAALRFPLSPWYFPGNLWRAGRLFRRHRADVLIGYTSVPNLYAGWLWRLAGARAFLWNQRNAGLDRPPAFLERAAVKNAKAFVANSPSGAEFLERALGVQGDACRLVPNGVEIPVWPAGAERRPGAPLRVVCVANGRPVKDHETLLRAWSRVQGEIRKAGVAARLELAGDFDEEPEHARRLREMAAAPELAGSVDFCGAVQDIHGLLAEGDIGVLSSRSEGMPNAVLEYMAAGLPVVATDLPGIRRALGGEAAGPGLVPVGDAEALAERLLDLLGNAAKRTDGGRRNRERAIREFSVEAMAERMTAVIREALP
jgi:glycosyltransferase involved in cell wall biosynthesis